MFELVARHASPSDPDVVFEQGFIFKPLKAVHNGLNEVSHRNKFADELK